MPSNQKCLPWSLLHFASKLCPFFFGFGIYICSPWYCPSCICLATEINKIHCQSGHKWIKHPFLKMNPFQNRARQSIKEPKWTEIVVTSLTTNLHCLQEWKSSNCNNEATIIMKSYMRNGEPWLIKRSKFKFRIAKWELRAAKYLSEHCQNISNNSIVHLGKVQSFDVVCCCFVVCKSKKNIFFFDQILIKVKLCGKIWIKW